MLKRTTIMAALLAMLLAGFAIGMAMLLQLRFDAGDIYPPYSSLRSDPMGTKAFFTALGQLDGVETLRHMRLPNKLPEGRDTALLSLGTQAYQLEWGPEKEAEIIETFMKEGGRVVVTLYPETIKGWRERREEEKDAKKTAKDKEKKQEETEREKRRRKIREQAEDEGFAGKWISFDERWAFEIDVDELPKNDKGVFEPVTVRRQSGSAALPEAMEWHSAAYFSKAGKGWRTIYSWKDQPVAIERDFGEGSMVILTDSYFLSNEALRLDRHPQLLAWLIGPARKVIFDEAHLGIMEQPGIAALIRKYRLHGLVAGLILLAGLFVWKNAVSLVPPYAERGAGRDSTVEGRETAAGFTNLLRRSIPTRDLLAVCAAEWQKSCAHGRPDLQAKAARIEAIAKAEQSRPARERDPLNAYKEACRIIAEKK